MPFVKAQFLRDPDQVAALVRLPGIAAGETEPGPARAEAGSAAAAGDPFPAKLSPFNELQLMNENMRIGGHLPLIAAFVLLQEFLSTLGAQGDYRSWFSGRSDGPLE